MIIVEQKDNIFDVIYKIKKYKGDDKTITIHIPFWHNILYNKVSLKSIKESTSKKIVISTNDILSKKIWKNIWVKYNIIKDSNYEIKKDLLKYNYSFYEYLIYEIKSFKSNILNKIFKKHKTTDPRKHFLKFYRQKSHLPIFIWILIITLIIFTYIFFFALNKTYVYINPDIQVKTKAQNFIFEENVKNKDNWIELKVFTWSIKVNKKIKSTWILQNDRYKAKWEVIIYNKLFTEIKLRPNTRLESQNWILYETKSYIRIPSAQKNKIWTVIPWSKKIEIIAKLKDKNWSPIWVKWNINKKDVVLTIPWLEKEDRINIFAKTTTKLEWWKDIYEKIVSQNDIDNAKTFFLESLKKEAIKEINSRIKQINSENNIEYKILAIDNIYKYSNIDINIPEIKPWDKIEEFEAYWKIDIKTYAFNVNSVTSKLKNTIELWLLPEKEKLLYINNKSISIFPKKWVLFRRENPIKIKATLEIDYNIEYNFSKDNDNYISRLKQTISWLDKEKAEIILINESKISNAKIEIRPFFVNKVSKYLNNIEFITEK